MYEAFSLVAAWAVYKQYYWMAALFALGAIRAAIRESTNSGD